MTSTLGVSSNDPNCPTLASYYRSVVFFRELICFEHLDACSQAYSWAIFSISMILFVVKPLGFQMMCPNVQSSVSRTFREEIMSSILDYNPEIVSVCEFHRELYLCHASNVDRIGWIPA